MTEQELKPPCPEFPFFGAWYPDARCIDGFLWDLDYCDENGLISKGYHPPCPFCNKEKFIEYYTDLSDQEVEEMKNDESLSESDIQAILKHNRTRADAQSWVNLINEKYNTDGTR